MSLNNNQNNQGIRLMLLGCIVLPMMDACAKYMGEAIASSIIVFCRFAFQSVFVFPFVWKSLYVPRGKELALHVKRSLSLAMATLCFFTAIQVMPIADALAIFFVMPLIVTLLAPWILGESVGWHRIGAAIIGMFGAVIIIQPGQEVFGIHAFLPLLTAVGFSFYLMYTRKLARSDDTLGIPPLTMQFFSGIFGALITLVAIVLMQPFEFPVFAVSKPDLLQWLLLFLVGFFAASGHMLVTSAFKYADASVLAPFQYAELVVAAILGWLIFDDIPALSSWIGSVILVASGLYIFHRERTLGITH